MFEREKSKAWYSSPWFIIAIIVIIAIVGIGGYLVLKGGEKGTPAPALYQDEDFLQYVSYEILDQYIDNVELLVELLAAEDWSLLLLSNTLQKFQRGKYLKPHIGKNDLGTNEENKRRVTRTSVQHPLCIFLK